MMRTPALLLVAAVAAVLPATAFAQTGVTDPQTLTLCAAAGNTPLPAADRPTPEEARALTGCTSADLYYGFGGPPDVDKARKCAYVEMDQGNTHQPFGGKTILMMIYANGSGAKRNFDVALKLACEVPGSPGDIAGRVREIARYKASNWTGENFSVCNHSGDRYMYGQCAQLDYRIDRPEREKRLDAIAAKLLAQQKPAFQTLRQSATAFFAVQAAKGQDLSATFEVHELGFQERTLVSSLEQFEQGGDLPQLTADDARTADAEMDATLNQVLARKFNSPNLTADGIRQAQQAWLVYRDAWVAFGTLRYPSVSAASWRAWITDQRVGVLKNILI